MLSICIPSRGRAELLWATICACELALKGMEREYIIHLNGKTYDNPRTFGDNPEPMDEPHYLIRNNSDGAVKYLYSAEPIPPPIARNECAKIATGDYLVFFDDHCLPDPDWFTKLLELDKDIVHSSYSTHVGYHRYYHFIHLGDPNPLKGDYSRAPLSQEPYQCASAPHGGFGVKRAVWDALGGYGDFWQGFGGEEAYFDMLAAKKGFEVWMHPQMHFYHFSCRAETRGYDKGFNPWNFEEGWRRLIGS